MGRQMAGLKPDRVFVTHGEDKVTKFLQKTVGRIPLPGDSSVLRYGI